MIRSLPSLSGLAALFGLVAGSPLPAWAAPTDWPGFRGPTGLGTSPSRGLPTTWSTSDNIVWKTALPGPGTSSPVVWGDAIYLTAYTGFGLPNQRSGSMDELRLHLICLDRESGEVRWTTDVKPNLPEQATIREGHGYASSTPAVDAERTYVFCGRHDGQDSLLLQCPLRGSVLTQPIGPKLLESVRLTRASFVNLNTY